MQNLKSFVKKWLGRLKDHQIKNFEFEFFTLLQHYTGKTKLDSLFRDNITLNEAQIQLLENKLSLLIDGVPLYRIIGEKEFYGIKLKINEHCLEPRNDTEILVNSAINYIKNYFATYNIDEFKFLDLGIGSGAISLAILKSLENYPLLATGVDINPHCLDITLYNSKINNISEKITLLESDCFNCVTGQFDLIISNPPYISKSEIEQLDNKVLRFDPLRALQGGNDGLYFYRIISEQAKNYLLPSSAVMLEIGRDQNSQVKEIFQHNGFRLLFEKKDLAGNDRVLAFTN